MAATSAGQAGCGDVTIKQQQQQQHHQQHHQSSIIVSQAMPGTIVSALVSSSHQVSQQPPPPPPPTHMQRPSSYMQQRMPNSSTSSHLQQLHQQHPQQQQQLQFIDNNFTNTGAVTCQSSSLNVISNSYHSEQSSKSSVESGNSSSNNVIVNYNLAPSWKRLIHNGEVVYVSPSDATLRDIMQVKQYLLSTGTCKCGLPCPIRPESFFDFNIETPTVQMPPSVTDSINSSCCSHRRYVETSQDSGSSRDSSVPPERKIKVTQNILITPGMQRIVNQRDIKDGNVLYHEQDVSKLGEGDSQQWQKLQQQQQQQNQTINGRVPPLPQQHSASSSSPMWQDDAKPNFGNKGKIVKKRPTFKDDPTGYLNHQTAILHNSISTIYSPNAGTNDVPPGGDNALEQKQQETLQQGQKVFVQQPYPNQRIRDVPENNQKIITDTGNGNSRSDDALAPMLAGQSVTHMPNGIVQVHQNCDMRQIKQQIQHQIEQRNLLIKQNQQLARMRNNVNKQQGDSSISDTIKPQSQYVFVQSPIESPVSSSTALNRSTPEMRSASSTPDSKGPLQGTNVTTSNDNLSNASPSPEYISGGSASNSSLTFTMKRKIDSLHDQSLVKNTVTSVVAGRNITTTTNAGMIQTTNMADAIQGGIFAPNGTILYKRPAPKQVSQTMIQNCVTTPGTNMQQLNLQTLQRDSQGQFIITPNSQVVMMPSGTNHQKNGGTMITTNSNIGQFVGGNIVINNGEQQTMLQSPNSGVLIQNSVQPQQSFLQSSNNLIANNNPNFVSNLQQMILNNGNIIHSPSGQNILSSPNANMITTVPSASPKMIQSAGNTVQVIQNSSSGQQIITQQHNGQTVVLNTLPNGMIVQQPMEGQIVNRIIQDGSGMMLSPDSKRKTKKRKGTTTPQGLSPQGQTLQLSPTIQQSSPHTATQSQASSMLHVNAISQQYQGQNFQLSPGLSGLTIVPKSNQGSQNAQPQQQILVQNGQTIIQPLGLLGQQLLVPAGLVITPDSNLVQIQNIGQMGNIITPQGMVIRAQSPQQKQFLSPSTGQYIVSNNGQVSPMGQIYGGLVQVPQSNATNGQNAGMLQQNTIVQQAQHHNQATSQGNATTTTIINNAGQQFLTSHTSTSQHNTSGIMTAATSNTMKDFLNAGHSVSTQTAQQQLLLQSSPPDTTTHSPQSPERPSSARSGASYEGMAMVQCVSSSEPDSVVSPTNIDPGQLTMPNNHIEYIEQKSGQVVQYLTSSHLHKPSDPKIKRIQMNARRNYYMTSTNDGTNSRPDPSESFNSNSPTQSSMSPETKNVVLSSPTFSPAINELVWGPARGYPAWPGKIVIGPEGVTTPNDCVWIRWFGGRANIEMTSVNGLKTLTEGLEAHHSALKDTRKSRKLNSQLERAIQEAMAELDQTPSKTTNLGKINAKKTASNLSRGRQTSRNGASNNNNQRKPVKIAPAPTASNIK